MVMIRPKKTTQLSHQIVLILLIKCCLLWLIWLQWFSHPVAQHMKVDDSRIQQQFFSPSLPASSSPKELKP